LPDSSAKKVEKPAPKAAARAATYTVKRGDNLSTIAKRFGLTVTRLKSLNGLRTSNLQPGQKLKTG
jgi:LysM repeat protein